jgi:hypothetical protein
VTTCGSAPPTFSVVASGTAPLTYQWSAAFGLGPFVDIPSATGDSYTPPAYSASDSGVQFRCSVTNACGAAVSNLATWTINGSTLVDPDHTACEGEVVTFHAAGSNTPSGFQWQIGGADADLP